MKPLGNATPRWRDLAPDEQALLEAILSQAFEGSPELLRQLRNVQARSGCPCGCGTLDLNVHGEVQEVPGDSYGPIAAEADVLDATGGVIGSVLVFVRGGRLATIEVFGYGDESLTLPVLSNVRLRVNEPE